MTITQEGLEFFSQVINICKEMITEKIGRPQENMNDGTCRTFISLVKYENVRSSLPEAIIVSHLL